LSKEEGFELQRGHGGSKEIIDVDINPVVDLLMKLSGIANNFACTANHVSNVNATECHEIKELLDLTFDVRKIAEKVLDAAEDRFDCYIKNLKD
jgi:hypothetical protein